MNGASVTSSVSPTLSIVFQEVGPAKGVVVQQNDHIAASSRDAGICGPGVARIVRVGDKRDVREERAELLLCPIGRPSIGDDDAVSNALAS